MPVAADSLDCRLQVGRFLRGRLLALAVVLRELPTILFDSGGDRVAPAWIVVSDRHNGADVLRVGAGRGAGVGELLLTTMQREAAVMERDEFLARWREPA